MLTLLIGAVALILGYVCIANGEWGPFALLCVIVVTLMVLSHTERVGVKAWRNRQRYWAYGEEPTARRK